jgi:hypothetical protein
MHNTAIIDNAGDVGSKPDGCTFEKTTRQTDRPGIKSLFNLRPIWGA